MNRMESKTYSLRLQYIRQCRSCPCSAATLRWVPTYSKGKGERRVSYKLSKDVCPAVYYMNDKYKN